MATTTGRKVSKGNFALYIILFIVLLALNGVLNFIVAELIWTTLLTASYWLKTIAGAASGLGSFIIFAFMRRDTTILNNETYNQEYEELNGIISTEVDDDFSDYIAYENREMKKQRWRQKWQNKKTKWQDKIPARILNAIKLLKEDKWDFQIPWWRLFKKLKLFIRKHRAAKWQKKLDKINERLSKEWIEENIDYQKIKYPDITPSEILTGERKDQSNKIIDNNAFSHIFRDRMPIIGLTLFAQAGYHALNIVQAINPAGLIMGIAVQLSTILINAVTGNSYGNTLFKKLDHNNLYTRRSYLMGYLKWKKKSK